MKFRLGQEVECSVDNIKWEKCFYLFYQGRQYYAVQIIMTNSVIRYFSYCRKIKNDKHIQRKTSTT